MFVSKSDIAIPIGSLERRGFRGTTDFLSGKRNPAIHATPLSPSGRDSGIQHISSDRNEEFEGETRSKGHEEDSDSAGPSTFGLRERRWFEALSV
jgi:hypothetical protein